MATCNICEYAGRPSYKSPCSECRGYSKYKYKKMQTNADRFRSMTDEELATALYQMLDGDVYCTNKPECGKMLNTDDGIPDEWFAQCLLNWLRQTAKEELWNA